MKKWILFSAVVIFTILGILHSPALAAGGFSIGPAKLVVSVPEDGSSSTHVYVTSDIDGELIVGAENIPFRVEPETIPINATDRERKVELLVFGSPDIEAGEYSGKLTFRARSDSNIAYGVKIKTTITQTIPEPIMEPTEPAQEATPQPLPEEADGKPAETNLIDTVKDNMLVIILGALVLILLAVLIGITIGRKQGSKA